MRGTSTTIRATTVISTRTTTLRPFRPAPAWPLVAALAWTLFAFAGLYAWTLVPLALIVLAGLLVVRPRIIVPWVPWGSDSLLDAILAVCLIAVLIQILPLPAAIHGTLSPHEDAVERALRVETPGGGAVYQPLSIRPAATALSVAYLAMLCSVFWLARSIFERRVGRPVVRWVAWLGLAVSVTAIVQLATSPLLIYGFWPPEDVNARPFGPFVNRNHMATWLLLAIPLTCGSVMARLRGRLHRQSRNGRRLVGAVDSTTVWRMGAVGTMVSALFVSVSRSGVIGLVVAAATGFGLARTKLGAIKARWLAAAAAFALFIATYLANFDELASRFARAIELGTERSEIWRQTLLIVRDFAMTGTGEGTFNRAMLVYQQGDRQLLFNNAHNQYLQIAAEGGLLVGLPAFLAVIALLVLLTRRLRRDTTAFFWLRAGATAGLVAVGVQSLWEIGLCMPANGVLFAVCAALAIHKDEGGE